MKIRFGMKWVSMVVWLLCAAVFPATAAEHILVEAEAFTEPGGWVNDSQFMDQMGSPFLLAHGIGRPVADAETEAGIPKSGTYRVWVRTRDWASTWTKGRCDAPGKFRVVVNGHVLETVFGTEGEAWHWQDGGTVELKRGEASLKLHDQTGFEGRCDAILLTSDLKLLPPDEAPSAWRQELLGLPKKAELVGDYDLVVVGGGVAGMTTAISAGKLGLSVALIHNRPVLGGNASQEAGVGYAGDVCFEPYPQVGRLTYDISWSYGGERRKWRFTSGAEAEPLQLNLLKREGVDLFLNFHANEVKTDKKTGCITEVGARNIVDSRRIRVKGRWFADTTGDGCIGYLAGADYDQSAVHMGRANLWGIRDTGKAVEFPICSWALDLTEKPFPGRKGKWTSPNDRFANLGGWYWESGFEREPFEESEQIRDNNFRAMYGAWDCLKNVDREYENHEIASARFIAGKRESRRLLGDVVLSTVDIQTGKIFTDGCVPLNWDIDVHMANPWFTDKVGHKEGFTGWPFISDAPMGKNTHYKTRPYWLSYRCLYSRNIPNLFMAGRDISVTHEALGAARVQPTTGMMGEVVGMAASLCKKHGTNPRGIYESHLDELKSLMERGVGEPLVPTVFSRDEFDGLNSGEGWKSEWELGGDVEIVEGQLLNREGPGAAVRHLETGIRTAPGSRQYLSFLLKRGEEAAFSIEGTQQRSDSNRFGLAVNGDGKLEVIACRKRTLSEEAVCKADKTYLCIIKFYNTGSNQSGSETRVKLYEIGKDRIPSEESKVKWDLLGIGGCSHETETHIELAFDGAVEFDRFRYGNDWGRVTEGL